ncbi:DUF3788 domain-containing protein [Inconstantimicrobium mannanitabidum]|uniref:Uncharacterized protein n=1 Tax=Inconstantimicrobium mannanitabidum TaxID=1604901 RepID=A0ACB5RG08_9CLOT|nr:DUF3788 domain-containing protein [Clostridium sp. TW13]GKX68022.1 hypothetical protein rsdtw13_32800 [Clostridium sp. TW13]
MAYERMLDKQVVPSFDEMISYCGENGELWVELDEYLRNKLGMKGCIRFPYGNKYGWSVKYSLKSKHICDVFAENGAFMALIRISNGAMEPIYNDMSDYAKAIWDDKYPCGSGGWMNYRVISNDQLQDLMKIMEAKVSK